MRVVEQAHQLGIRMAFGTDLIGAMHRRQSEEFDLRADLVPAPDLVRMATVNGAALIRKDTSLGQVKPGFEADLIAVRGNPLENARLLANPSGNLAFIMKGGRIIKQPS